MQQLTGGAQPARDARKFIEDLFGYLAIIRRGWRLIALAVIVCLVVACLYVSKTKSVYKATARLLVLQQGGRWINVSPGGDPLQAVQSEGDSLATHVLIIRSPVIVERAVAAAGLKGLSVGSVIDRLTVTLPEGGAKILDLTYTADTSDEAGKVSKAIIASYDRFLKDNYQRNTNGVISLITKARDELSKELAQLEKKYLEFRQNKSAHSVDAQGRPFIAVRVEHWNRAANEAVARELQLEAQLKRARVLADRGADYSQIKIVTDQLSGMAGGSPVIPDGPEAPGLRGSGSSYEGLRRELADVEFRRRSTERLLENLREGLAARAAPVPDEPLVARAFYADPDVAQLRDELDQARGQLEAGRRLAAVPSDPSIRRYQRQVQVLKEQLDQLWRQRQPEILARLRPPDEHETTRQAESELLVLRAREMTLREQIDRIRAEQLRRLREDRGRLARLHGPDDPRVLAVRERLAAFERPTEGGAGSPVGSARTVALIDSLEKSLEAVRAMRAEIQERFEADLDEGKKAEIDLLAEANLRNEMERQKAIFESVTAQLKQAQLTSDFGSVTAQTINPPSVLPIKPNAFAIIVLALIAGLGLGTAAAFTANLMDLRVRTLPQLRAMLDLPVLAAIPRLSLEQAPRSGQLALLSHESPRSPAAESYRSARTNLEFLRRNRRTQVLLVSSPNPGDGKSVTASNLAIVLARAGRKVLLVDADLRKPSLHGIYNLCRDRGLAQILGDGLPFDQAVQPTLVENLNLITSGPDVPNPAELLASDRLGQFLEGARSAHDVVIFDTSPLLAVTDPWIVSAVADGILVVVRIEETRRQDIERTMEVLRAVSVPVIGAVVNGVAHDQIGHNMKYDHAVYCEIGRPCSPGAVPTVGSGTPSVRFETAKGPNELANHRNGTPEHRTDGKV